MKKANSTGFGAMIRAWAAIALLSTHAIVALAGEARFSGVERIVAVSDIHGDYSAMIKTFTKAGIIDNNLAWSGSEIHLVITGDLLDRGPDSRLVMDLIMRLEGEAEVAGGEVEINLEHPTRKHMALAQVHLAQPASRIRLASAVTNMLRSPSLPNVLRRASVRAASR